MDTSPQTVDGQIKRTLQIGPEEAKREFEIQVRSDGETSIVIVLESSALTRFVSSCCKTIVNAML